MISAKLLAADALGEARVGAVRVEEDGSPTGVGADTVQHPGRGRVERARFCTHDVVADHEPDLALQDEEGVHLVGVMVRPDARPGGLDLEPEHGELGSLAEDRGQAVLPLEGLAASGRNDQGVRRGPAAFCRRRVLVEVVDAPAEVVGEPAARRVVVQEANLFRAVVCEAVHDPGRHHDERAGRRRDESELGTDLEGHRAVEHVEGVDVVQVDVRLGAALPGRVARPRDVQPLVLAEDAELTGGRVGDRLALALAGS